MLSQRYAEQQVKTALIPRANWHPFPTATERTPWESLPASVRQAHIKRGEEALGHAWPALPATLYMEYARNGNRSHYEGPCFSRRRTLCDLTIAECVEGKGRFMDDIANGIWAICEESSWVIPAHINRQKAGKGLPDTAEPVVDLFAAETSALLSWVLYLLSEKLDGVSPLIVPRVEREIHTRILTPLFNRKDFGWMGFDGSRVNNWNPWIVSNWLATALVVEKDEGRRLKHVVKAMQTVDNFIDPYPADGGCDEGPGYWGRAGASLYDCLEWFHSATGGAVDVYAEPLVQNIGKFIYRVQISGRYFINFADAPPMVSPSPGVCYGYGKRINDPDMQALGAWSATEQNIKERGVGDSIGRQLPTLFMLDELLTANPAPPLPRDVFLDHIQVFVARDKKASTDGFFVAAKGGHNAESHNHNDVGHVVLSLDGKPILVDAGVETYTAKTFSSERYTIWTMQSAYHALPTVNGVQQSPGKTFAASNVSHQANDTSATLRLDIAGAYPKEAGIASYMRTVTLTRGKDVSIADTYQLSAPAKSLTMNLLTACATEASGKGVLKLKQAPLADGRTSGEAALHFDADLFDVAIEPTPIEDGNLKRVWGEKLTRIALSVRNPQAQGEWTLRITR